MRSITLDALSRAPDMRGKVVTKPPSASETAQPPPTPPGQDLSRVHVLKFATSPRPRYVPLASANHKIGILYH